MLNCIAQVYMNKNNNSMDAYKIYP